MINHVGLKHCRIYPQKIKRGLANECQLEDRRTGFLSEGILQTNPTGPLVNHHDIAGGLGQG